MSMDLLTLGIAAAMPVAVFILFLLVRSRLDAWARRPRRNRRRGAARPVTAEVAPRVIAPVAAAPEWPRSPEPQLTVERPRSPEPQPRAEPAHIPEPQLKLEPPTRPQPSRPMLAKLPTSRPAVDSPPRARAGTALAPSPAADRHGPEPRSVGGPSTEPGLVDQPSALLTRPFQAHPVTPAPAPTAAPTAGPSVGPFAAPPAAPSVGSFAAPPAGPSVGPPVGTAVSPRPAVAGATRNPQAPSRGLLRGVLGRLGRDARSAEPRWPDPDQPDGSYRLFEYFEESWEPCPACAEWRERGARFCRRCGKPVDARSRDAVRPAAPRPIPLPTRAADVPAVAGSPVVDPARYTPATFPAAARASSSPPTAIAIGTTTSAGVAVGPGAPDDAAKLAGDGTAAAAPATPSVPAEAATNLPVRGGNGHVIDLNHATIAQLTTLHGVGRATAQRIITAREEQAFASVDALAERKVVGRSVLEKLRDQVTVGPSVS